MVTDYVRTAEPVGSRTLVSRYTFNVKSATIQNELAELSDLGYLRQPHTSSGRVPSDLGYRFYVDRLMEMAGISNTEAAKARTRLENSRSEVDLVMEQTCRILSDLAHYTSVATSPNVQDSVIRHISVTSVGKNKLLAIIVLDNGRVLHELLDFDSSAVDPVRATNFLTDQLAACTMESAVNAALRPAPDHPDLARLLDRVIEIFKRELESMDSEDVHLGGASYIMQQPEFKDIERLEAVLTLLEQRNTLYKLLSTVFPGSEVTVIIGAENPVDSMRDCSFVGTRYRINGRVAGTIGLVGPTRMDYRRAVGAVEFMARNLSDLLSDLSVS